MPLHARADGSVTVPMKILLPPAPGGSEYKVIVEADPNKAIQETNEDNNTDYVPIPAKVCG
jgi:CARDB